MKLSKSNGSRKESFSTKMDELNDNLYGAHLLVDFKPIEDADQLLGECEVFTVQAKQGMISLPFTIPSLKNWRTKRRDNKLMIMYDNLYPRVLAAEKVLRNIIGEVVEKKIALRTQAKYLQIRLQTCIKFNRDILSISENPLEDMREFVNKLSNESATLKTMILFNKEILRIKNIESISKGKSFVRWGPKPSMKKNVTEADLANDRDHQMIQLRLEQLRQVREKFVTCLGAILENRGTHLANLENCERSLEALNIIIKRGGATSYGEDIDPNVGVLKFDHDRCSDCSYGYSITCDCTNHLAALQKQAVEANMRLQALVEMRERMTEVSDEISYASNNNDSSNSITTLGTVDKNGNNNKNGVKTNSETEVVVNNRKISHERDRSRDLDPKILKAEEDDLSEAFHLLQGPDGSFMNGNSRTFSTNSSNNSAGRSLLMEVSNSKQFPAIIGNAVHDMNDIFATDNIKTTEKEYEDDDDDDDSVDELDNIKGVIIDENINLFGNEKKYNSYSDGPTMTARPPSPPVRMRG
eukprot:gene10107-13583_t